MMTSRWTPADLGALLLGQWDAEVPASINKAGAVVTTWTDIIAGCAPTQALAGAKPLYSATSFNGRPGITFDGTDDFLRAATQPFPIGANASEIWLLASQDLPAATTGTRNAVGYGTASGAGIRQIKRTITAGVNHAFALCGNSGGAGISIIDTLLDYSGRHVQRVIFGPATLGLEGDGLANPPVAMVPGTTAGNFTIGATNTVATAQLWSGTFNSVLVTAPLPANDAAQLLSYLKARGGIS